MATKVLYDSVYVPSRDVVVREIEGEIVIVPLTRGIGDMEDDLFTLNKTGRAIWERMDGKRSLKEVVKELSADFGLPVGKIKKDVMGFTEELVKRRILVEVR